jgi:PiT family inorganic phosphate transporter
MTSNLPQFPVDKEERAGTATETIKVPSEVTFAQEVRTDRLALLWKVTLFVMFLLLWIVARRPPGKVNRVFRVLQLFSASFMAFSHGSNDAQKTMGIIALALFSTGAIDTFTIPLWVVAAAATAMALGTYSGGWRIIHTLGSRVIKLDPIHGFASETSAATVIQVTAHLGFPISTTQAITAAIMGSGSTQRMSAVRWSVAGDIGTAWILTIPAAGLIAAGAFWLLDLFV